LIVRRKAKADSTLVPLDGFTRSELSKSYFKFFKGIETSGAIENILFGRSKTGTRTKVVLPLVIVLPTIDVHAAKNFLREPRLSRWKCRDVTVTGKTWD